MQHPIIPHHPLPVTQHHNHNTPSFPFTPLPLTHTPNTQRGYSLADLSKDDTLMRAYSSNTNLDRAKVSMKDLFGKPNMKKDGTAGKLEVVPPVEELQVGEETRKYWIDYSAFDAKATWHLYKALEVCCCGGCCCLCVGR